MLCSFILIFIECIVLLAMLVAKKKFVLSKTFVFMALGFSSLLFIISSCFFYREALSPYIKMLSFMDVVLVYFVYITYRISLSLVVFVFNKCKKGCVLTVKIWNMLLMFINHVTVVAIFFIPFNFMFYDYNTLVIVGAIVLSCVVFYIQGKVVGKKINILNYIDNSLTLLYAVALLLLSYNIFLFIVFEIVKGVAPLITVRKKDMEMVR